MRAIDTGRFNDERRELVRARLESRHGSGEEALDRNTR
jgi:hypothetical protein